MYTFLKAQASSLISTAVDYVAMILGVEFIGMAYGTASAVGNLAGAVANYSINKKWVFSSSLNQTQSIIRYIIVWLGYVALSSSLVVLLTFYTNFNYIAVKTIVAVALGISYNYLLQKKFVFN